MRAGDARRAEVRHEGVAVDEALAAEVAPLMVTVPARGGDGGGRSSAGVDARLAAPRRSPRRRALPAVIRDGEDRRCDDQPRPGERAHASTSRPPSPSDEPALTLRTQSSRRAPSEPTSRSPAVA